MVDFTGMIKHVGVVNNTGKNVVIAFMSLPGDDNNALVIDVDALPDNFNESLRRIVESDEGQQALNVGDVLGRRMSPDGSNTTLLAKLHAAGRLQKVPVELITLTPKKGIRWPLRDILKAMNTQNEQTPDGWDDLDPETKAQVASNLKKFNVHENNMQGEYASDNREKAAGLLKQAELLEHDAHNIRMRAYSLNPALAKPLTDLPKPTSTRKASTKKVKTEE